MNGKYEVLNYLSVEQNSRGKWVVGAIHSTKVFVILPDDAKPRDVCQFLKRDGYLVLLT